MPKVEASEAELKGETTASEDLKVTEIRLPAKDLLAHLCWADAEGTVLLALEASGVLHWVTVPEFKETHLLDTQQKCSALSMSRNGAVLTLSDAQELWVVDPQKRVVKRSIAAPGVHQAVSSPRLPIAIVSTGQSLGVVDLAQARAVVSQLPVPRGVGFENPVVSPDGKFVFTRGGIEQLHRFRLTSAHALRFEESSPRIASGRIGAGIQVSPDSKYVCLPSGGGNPAAAGHPQAPAYSTYVYPIDRINLPAFVLNQGAYPSAVGFDPVAKLVYSQNHDHPLIVFSDTGVKKKEYTLGGRHDVRQYLVHPDGRKLLLLTDASLRWVELP